MRVLFTTHYALPHLGGIEVAVDGLARELSRRGHEVVHLASTGRSGPTWSGPATPYEVVRVRALNVAETRLGVPWPLFSPALLPEVRRRVAAADVVHSHGMLYMSSGVALEVARRRGRAAVLTEHVGHVRYESPLLDAVESAAIRSVGRATVRAAEAVVVLNDKVRDELLALDADRPIVSIANGVDTTTYRPASPHERAALRAELGWDEEPRVLFVGRMVAKKGIHLAVEAAAAAGGAFRLVVVGPGRPPGETSPAVELLGAQSPARVASLYRAADALLLPSHGEGFPITVQEAMASDLPVVISDDPSYAPYVAGAGPGARLVARDAGAIVDALKELLADAESRRAAGSAAGEHARRSFSWARAADEHEALYQRLMRSRRNRRAPPQADRRATGR